MKISLRMNFVNGTGWDTHNQGQLNQHILIEELDDGDRPVPITDMGKPIQALF